MAAVAVAVAMGCGGSGAGPDGAPGLVDGAPADAADTPGDAAPGDAAGSDGGGDQPDAGSDSTYRNSLSVCWTDATCDRVMAIAHGGMWDALSVPYDSDAAIAAAYDAGFEGVKIDVRITSDGVPVIAHSSPIEIYESLDCAGQRIEEMTAAEVTGCHRLPSDTETFQRLEDVLEYLRGKMVAQLCVKRSVDYAATIADVLAWGAEDFAFLEISTAELQDQIPGIANSDQVYYLINVASDLSRIDVLIDTIANPRAFMYEMDPTVDLGDLVATRLHPAGVRAFTYDSSTTLSVDQIVAYYDQGYDVVSSQAADNGVTARIQVNQAHGVSPP